MKKKISLLLFLFSSLFVFAISETKMYVSIEKAQVREKPRSLSTVVEKLDYAAQVEVVDSKGKWLKVQFKSDSGQKITGWVQESALTSRKIVAKGSRVTADTDELALAGKGFSSEVEDEYKKSGKVNYDAVDEMEKEKNSSEELIQFILEGDLNGGDE